jgi:hypothetical protein
MFSLLAPSHVYPCAIKIEIFFRYLNPLRYILALNFSEELLISKSREKMKNERRESSNKIRERNFQSEKQFSKININIKYLPSVENSLREGKVIINENFFGIKNFFSKKIYYEGEFMFFSTQLFHVLGFNEQKTAPLPQRKKESKFSVS